MYPTYHLRQKFKLFFMIFVPILIYQFANYSASFIDTMMTGQYDTIHLAGVSMGTSLWSPFFTFLTGIVSALVPIIGQHLGRGDKQKIASDLYQFVYMAFLLSIFLFALVGLGARPILAGLHLEKLVFDVANQYLFYLMIGIVPFLLFSVFRSFFDSLGLTRLSMYLMLLLVPFNSFFNYILIYGKFGFPQMGGAGAGLGTSLSYWVLLFIVVMVLLFHPKVREYQIWKIRPFNFSAFLEGLKLGLPIGGAVFAEVAVFSGVGLLMAKFSSEIIASHQAAMNFSTLMYAFPISVSTAMAIIVAYEVGAGRFDEVKKYCNLGRLVALAFAFFTLAFLYIFRFEVAALYGNHPDFVRLTSIFLTYSLFFQLADTFAAPIQGILRGYKDTTIPFLLGILSYWGVSIPIGIILDQCTDLGPFAYWVGLIIGLVVCGVLLRIRLMQVEKKSIHSTQ